jgi:protein TonB
VAKPTPAPVPPPPPAPAAEPFAHKTATDMKNTLTPGDPGSDVSPFFTPGVPKPAAPAEKPRVQPVAAPPAPAPVARPVKPVEKTVKPATSATTGSSATTGLAAKSASTVAEPTRPIPPASKPEPSRPEPRSESKSEPTALDIAKKEMRPTMGGDIFQDFHEAEPEQRSGGFPKIIPIAIGIVAVAAVGFILLRPKRPAPAPIVPRETVQNQEKSTPSQPVVEPPANTPTTAGAPAGTGGSTANGAPVAKPAPAKQKAQPKAKPAEPDLSGADAILPILNNSSAALPPPPGSQPATGGGQSGPPAGQTRAETQQAKTEETAVQSGAEAATANPAGSGQVSDAGSPNVEAPPAAPAKEGDLVELAAVTEPPKLVKSADPIYPQTAQRLGVGGSITVNALIDEKGNVIDTGILKGIKDDKGLGRAAETAVRKWKFEPARKNGVAVKVWKSFVIAFKADANPANRTE